MRNRLATAGVLLALVAGLQYGCLHRAPEQLVERRAAAFGDLKASSMLPSYIGSLFLGSFRAVAIDVLWIQLSRMKQQEHRYFETVEIMELISRLQPRNPEVWSIQAWDMAYNIANQFLTTEEERAAAALREAAREMEPDRRRLAEERAAYIEGLVAERRPERLKWIRRGLLKLVEGSRHLPEDPYLKFQIGLTLQQKACPNDGEFDPLILQLVESDPELRAALDPGAARPRTALEISEAWFEATLRDLETLRKEKRFRFYQNLVERLTYAGSRPDDADYATTQMGLNIHPLSIAGFRYQVGFRQAMLRWNRWLDGAATTDPAASRRALVEIRDSLEQAAVRAERVLTYWGASAIFGQYAHMCRQLRGAADAQISAVDGGRPPTSREMLDLLIAARSRFQSADLDLGYALSLMSRLRRSLGGDEAEWNDDMDAATPLWRFHRIRGKIEAGDTDWFEEGAYGDPRKVDPMGRPVGPFEAGFRIRRRAGPPIRVIVMAQRKGQRAEVDRFELADEQAVVRRASGDAPGPVFIKVDSTAAGPQLTMPAYEIEPVQDPR